MIYSHRKFCCFLISLISMLYTQKPDTAMERIAGLDDGTPWLKDSAIKYRCVAYLGATVVTADALALLKLKDTWYAEKKGKMHSLGWHDDIMRWQQMDKIGHAVHGALAADIFSKSLRLSGFSANQSIWAGSMLGWLWILQIEIADSFFDRWGFSWGDLLGNTAGAGFTALRQYYPNSVGAFRLKASYHVSQAFKDKEYYRQQVMYIDDYEGLTFWLACNIYHIMPKKTQKSYPVWLKPFGIAIGHSAKGVATGTGYREFNLSLDIDLTKIPLGSLDRSATIKMAKDLINYIKIPAPTIRFSKHGTVMVGFYF